MAKLFLAGDQHGDTELLESFINSVCKKNCAASSEIKMAKAKIEILKLAELKMATPTPQSRRPANPDLPKQMTSWMGENRHYVGAIRRFVTLKFGAGTIYAVSI